MGVSTLKNCAAVNSYWNCISNSMLATKARVTISVTRFNMYQISYEPISWQHYFSERVATFQSLGIKCLFIQLRAQHSPPSAKEDVIQLLSTTPIKCLRLDVTFQNIGECLDFCGQIFQDSSFVGELTINFRLVRDRDDFFNVGRKRGKFISQSVVRLTVDNFPVSSALSERDAKNFSDFLVSFVNLRAIELNGIGLVGLFLKGLLTGGEPQMLSNLNSLTLSLRRDNG